MEKKIIKLLNHYGLEAWFCGGTARDLYIGKEPYEWDVSVKADLITIQNLFTDRLVKIDDFYTYVTILYQDVLYNLYPLKKINLINTYYNFDFTDSLKEDANTRDFTINSIFYNSITNEWIDLYNGINDIHNKIIRFIENPQLRIMESKIRLLRAPVLKAILGNYWELDINTKQAISDNYLRIAVVNPKQINKELVKLFTRSEKPSIGINEIKSLNLSKIIFPEIELCDNIPQYNKNENLDLYQHLMLTMDSISIDKENVLPLRIAGLLHDIAKPYTMTKQDNTLHFYNHDVAGSYISETILHRWGFNKSFINKISTLIKFHLFNNPKSINSIKNLISKVGTDNIQDLIDLRIADRCGTGKILKNDQIYKLRNKVNILLGNKNLNLFKLAITDSKLISLFDCADYIEELKYYISSKIILKKLKNEEEHIKNDVTKKMSINCPLLSSHLFKTYADLSNKINDIVNIDGTFKCGIFCNFKCKATEN